jgi:hypothetical protein
MDNPFSNSSVLIPAQLHDEVLREGFRPERQTSIYLVYHVISQKCSQIDQKWTRISDGHFKNLVKNHTQKARAKNWLEEKGFIQIKKWVVGDGVLRNSKKPGWKCQDYRVVEQVGGSMLVELWKRKLELPATTSNDPFCQYTREVLGKISVDQAQVGRMWRGEDEFSALPIARRDSILNWARTLFFGSGRINRGRRVNRLFSPWTCSPRELRRACVLAGEPIVSIDLQASQPTLIGLSADDDDFSQACLNDELYGQVCRLFAVERDEAKQIFLSYVYGRNRKQNAKNTPAFLVQEHIAERFPKTHSFIWQSKLHNHKAFSCRLQNQEAELFVSGIMGAMMQERIPVLTVHDSISVPAQFEQRALEITKNILGKNLGGKARVKISHYGNGSEKAISI